MQVDPQELWSLGAELVRKLRLLERQECACCGVPFSQAAVLRVLYERGGRRMSELADELGVAQSTATRLVGPLARAGWVERRAAVDDGRSVEVELTGEGRERAEQVLGGALRCSEGIVRAIPEAERPEVVRALRTLVAATSQCC